MQQVFGIETEYGIALEGVESVDVVAESIALVRSCPSKPSTHKWQYAREDPYRDVRGFRVKELLQDPDDAQFSTQDRARNLSAQEIKSDLVLANGCRFYNDHAHPEYSTPECASIRDLVAHDKAGEAIVAECARRRNRQLKQGRVRLFKNNTDFAGHSYGCHENYLLNRTVPFEKILTGMIPFLVTRQIYAGAGKMGIEAEGRLLDPTIFQLSQRADFFSVLVSIDTMNRRPLFNTRDEPHADPQKYRRLHIILGDANLSEIATALKIGTTTLVVNLIERGLCDSLCELAQPVEANKAISRDPTHRWLVERRDGRKISAVDVQRLYLAKAQQQFKGQNIETDWLLEEWETTLNDLARDPTRCADRLDWAAKKFLLETFLDSEKIERNDPWLQSLDLEYHAVDPAENLYWELVREGRMRRLVTDEEIAHAVHYPPTDTRACFRGRCVERFGNAMTAVHWSELVFATETGERVISLGDLFDTQTIQRYNQAVESAANVDELIARLR